MSGWIEIRVRVERGGEEVAAAEFSEAPFLGAHVEDGRVTTAVVKAEFDARLRDRLTRRFGSDVEFRDVSPRDYAEAWRDQWRSFRVGRIAVVAPGSTVALKDGDVRLELAPGGSFGTGRHATTRGALLGLQRFFRPGDRILDCGTGSGILAVAAALLGARSAFGFDIDPSSRPAAEELARRNRVADRCRFVRGSFEDTGGAGIYDGAVANLYYDLIQRHARDVTARVRAGGFAVFSGCTREHREATARAIEGAGVEIEWVFERRKWLAFGGRVRAP